MCYHWPLLKTFPGSQIYLINSSDLFKYFKLRLGNSFYNETDLWGHIYDNVEYYVLDIAQCECYMRNTLRVSHMLGLISQAFGLVK